MIQYYSKVKFDNLKKINKPKQSKEYRSTIIEKYNRNNL